MGNIRKATKRFLRGAGILLAVGLLILTVVILIPLRPSIDFLEPRASTQYWAMSGGYRIAYTRVPASGDPQGPPIIYLHGGPGGFIDSAAIDAYGRLAALGRDVYLYDQVGSGLSDRLARPKDYSFLGHVEDLREIIAEQIGADQVSLIGQSYGGQIVGYFLGSFPELVEKAVLTSPGGIEPPQYSDGRWLNERLYPVPDSLLFESPPIPDGWRPSSWPPRAIATIAFSTAFNVKLMSDEEADGVLNSIFVRIASGLVCDPAKVRLVEEAGGGMYAHGFGNWFVGVDGWRDALKRSQVPVLVVQGQCDFIPYPTAYEYVDLLPRGEYGYVKGAGHVIYWEKPDELIEMVAGFLVAGDSAIAPGPPR